MSERKKKKLEELLTKRKIELGITTKTGGMDEIKSLIYKDGEFKREKERGNFSKMILPDMKLADLDEEEERDKEAVILLMKKYSKLWRNLFSKYANSCFSTK